MSPQERYQIKLWDQRMVLDYPRNISPAWRLNGYIVIIRSFFQSCQNSIKPRWIEKRELTVEAETFYYMCVGLSCVLFCLSTQASEETVTIRAFHWISLIKWNCSRLKRLFLKSALMLFFHFSVFRNSAKPLSGIRHIPEHGATTWCDFTSPTHPPETPPTHS